MFFLVSNGICFNHAFIFFFSNSNYLHYTVFAFMIGWVEL